MHGPLTRNQEILLAIDGLTSEGQGIGRHEGFAVFVPFVLPGETALVRIIKPYPNYAIGKLLELKTESPERVIPVCGVFGKCGGCQLQHMRYDAQLVAKRRIVVDALTRLGGFADADALVKSTLGGSAYAYRNKGSFPVRDVDGAAKAGMFAQRSHRLIPLEHCPIARDEINAALKSVSRWLSENRIKGYDDEKHSGCVRHVMLRSAKSGLMAVVATLGQELPRQAALLGSLEGIATSVVHNINEDRTNTVLGKTSRMIQGTPLVEEMGGISFTVSDQSFMQVNTQQAETLYALVLDALALTGNETVADAYSGVGTIALALAKHCKRVVGIESIPEAVDDARKNAITAGVSNAGFRLDTVENALPGLVKEARLDAIVLDPPRKGCDRAALDAVAASGAKKVVYVSCNPATLARDAAVLRDNGYALVKATPVDMFPQTVHVETVALLQSTILNN